MFRVTEVCCDFLPLPEFMGLQPRKHRTGVVWVLVGWIGDGITVFHPVLRFWAFFDGRWVGTAPLFLFLCAPLEQKQRNLFTSGWAESIELAKLLQPPPPQKFVTLPILGQGFSGTHFWELRVLQEYQFSAHPDVQFFMAPIAPSTFFWKIAARKEPTAVFAWLSIHGPLTQLMLVPSMHAGVHHIAIAPTFRHRCTQVSKQARKMRANSFICQTAFFQDWMSVRSSAGWCLSGERRKGEKDPGMVLWRKLVWTHSFSKIYWADLGHKGRQGQLCLSFFAATLARAGVS